MYKAKLISADFEESTMEFEIEHEFTVKKGDYVILSEANFEELASEANSFAVMRPDGGAVFIRKDAENREDYSKEEWENIIKARFERLLLKLINAHCKEGLSKPDLVSKMQYITKSCEIS
jgi:hypothetical protein